MSSDEAIFFSNAEGLKLFGTLHCPATPNRDLPAVLLLSPGVKARVGPGRLYVPLTDMLVTLGYTVLRFDFYGLGDSEGELHEQLLADVYNNIEVGRYVDDALCALKWLEAEHGFNRFIVGGLCGGAITALLAAERDSRVESLLSLGMSITLASNAATPAKYLTSVQLDARRRGYYRRLLQPRSWLRFLTFQSQYDVIWRSLKRLVIKDKPRATTSVGDPEQTEQRGNSNPLFPRAFFAFLERGGTALMLFSGKDRLQSEYEEKFVAPHGARLAKYLSQLHQHVVPSANHVLSLHEWQQEMVAVSRQWLLKRHPGKV